jgi:hypothetical protein
MEGRGGTGMCPMAPSRSSPVESRDSIIVTKTVHEKSFHLKGIHYSKGKWHSTHISRTFILGYFYFKK